MYTKTHKIINGNSKHNIDQNTQRNIKLETDKNHTVMETISKWFLSFKTTYYSKSEHILQGVK